MTENIQKTRVGPVQRVLLLCRIGFHRWQRCGWIVCRCERCGAEKVVG